MYILPGIVKNGRRQSQTSFFSCVFHVFCVILAPEKVCLDTNIFSLSELETEILKQVYSDGHFEERPPLRSRVEFGVAL